MTNQEVAARFEVRWNGGPILPPYDSESTLAQMARDATMRHEDVGRKPRPNAAEKLRKYSDAQREAVKVLRQDGYTLIEIVQRTGFPPSTVYNFVTR